MLTTVPALLRCAARRLAAAVQRRLSSWTKPAPLAVAAGMAADVARSRRELILENALLRQQVVILHRPAKRPRLTALDRGLLVLLAGRLRTWAQALVIVPPETVLRWHRQGFRLVWRRTSTPRAPEARTPAETIALIRHMAAENRLWGADRIRGELLKLDVRVSKRTIQKYMRLARPRRPAGQSWSAFVRNHADAIWACDFLPVTDLRFRPLFAFFVIALGSRRVVHVGVTRHPTDAWVAQQLREATPFGERPRFLIRDNDGKYGALCWPRSSSPAIQACNRPTPSWKTPAPLPQSCAGREVHPSPCPARGGPASWRVTACSSVMGTAVCALADGFSAARGRVGSNSAGM